jgi:protein-L-isoaspartate(D-aspartate) O-methyltransferase
VSSPPEPPSPRRLVADLKASGSLRDPAIEAALLAVPRHLFLPNVELEQVYSDRSIPIKRDASGMVVSSSSQPTMMIIMLEQLRLSRGQNVLEIGAGTGYNAALIQHIVGSRGRVTTIELDKDLAQWAQDALQRAAMTQVMVVETDGAGGYPPRAAYDRIIATVGVWDVPRAWTKQLKRRGILVAPLWLEALQVSAALIPQPDGTLLSRDNRLCGFVQLRGLAAGPPTHIRVGSTALYLTSDSPKLDGAAIHALLSEDAEDASLGAPLEADEYWHGFAPYLMLNTPSDLVFAGYSAGDDGQTPYGISGSGFALIGRGTACFIPIRGRGQIRAFGSADAQLALQDALADWDRVSRPTIANLRLRLYPADQPAPAVHVGKVYSRRDHHVHAWLDV